MESIKGTITELKQRLVKQELIVEKLKQALDNLQQLEDMAGVDSTKKPTEKIKTDHKKRKSSSQYPGVSKNKKDGKWRAQINRKDHKYFKIFNTEIEAARAVERELEKRGLKKK